MYNNYLDINTLLFILELVVLLFLIWHLRELGSNSRELEKVIKEMHETHKELHEDTKGIKLSVDRLEKDLKNIVCGKPIKTKTKK